LKFDRISLDRTKSRAYAVAIDVSELEVQDAPWYVLMYRCGGTKCGLRVGATGALEVWEAVDTASPRKLRNL
jgi:hypothetical protein